MSLVMTETEQKQIDSQIEQMMDWAKSRKAEAEQLALDAARLMSCTSGRMDKLKKQGFFKRCWNRLTGKTGEMERANNGDLIRMQKMAFRYLNMLQEQQVLMAHSMLSLKNNLLSLAVKEEETRGLVALLAQRTQERFLQLETRVDQLEISTNLQGWLLGLEERDYDEKIPTEYMRLFRVINDFYSIKNDEWNYNDLMFMRKAIRTVGINPKKKLSLNAFIDGLTDEIQSDGVGFDSYGQAITLFKPEGIENYSKFVIDNISSPVFVSMHGLKTQYMDRLDIVEELQDEMNISAGEALKRLLRRSIANLNVNLDYEFPLAETAIEILGCLRLTEKLALPSETALTESDAKEETPAIEVNNTELQPASFSLANLTPETWQSGSIKDIISPSMLRFAGGKFWILGYSGVYSSSDLKNWHKDADSWHINNFIYKNGILITKTDNSEITMYQPGRLHNTVKLRKPKRNVSPSYVKFIYNKNKWFIVGSYMGSDGISKGKYQYACIQSGNSIDNLYIYTSSESFPHGNVPASSIILADEKIVMIVYDKDNNGKIRIATTMDGVSWNCDSSIDIAGYISTLKYFRGNVFFSKGNTIYTLDINSGEYTKYATLDNIAFSDIRLFSKYGLAVAYNSKDKKYVVSDDLKSWKAIEVPHNFNLDMIAYGNGLLAAIPSKQQNDSDNRDWLSSLSSGTIDSESIFYRKI